MRFSLSGVVALWLLGFLLLAQSTVAVGGEDEPEFLRGDVNGDGIVEPLTDSGLLIGWIVHDWPAPPCLAAADCNGNGRISALLDRFSDSRGYSG